MTTLDTTSKNGDATPTANLRALTILNECGDVTIAWTSDRDREMEEIIAKKMREGMIFYIIENRFGGRMQLTDAAVANQHRLLAIRDEDFARFVSGPALEAGEPRLKALPPAVPVEVEEVPTAAAVKTPDKPARSRRQSKSAREVAQSESIGVAPRRGG